MLWCLFFRIVIWIATLICAITGLYHYVDDTFGHDDSKELDWYKLYQTHYPPKLMIIGFEVDPQAMTITMPEEACILLATHLRGFINIPLEKHVDAWLRSGSPFSDMPTEHSMCIHC